jgi:hypothetical protein
MNQKPDPLRDHLREEAEAERPVFTGKRHRRIMRHVRDLLAVSDLPRRMMVSRWLMGAAAAICFMVGVTFFRVHHISSHLAAPRIAISPHPVLSPVAMTEPVNLPSLTIDFGGVISARLLPPEISVRLPGIDSGVLLREEATSGAQTADTERLASPEWLLDRLGEPARRSLASLSGVMPDNVQALAAMAKLQR